ncbi:Leucine-rich repeat-containing protein 56 [Myotis davidii]|uniref:Leucine-rich repeat-containing protein 56 n=1 Tax=Myotis davidii TaxID=225400 RepID=L5LQ88_MYODS|nr:Leucine-rich repeat-containing protein 56 [Myotis davidii]
MFDPQWEKASASKLDVNGPGLGQAPGPRPSMARVLVQELSWQGPYNPCLQSKACGQPQGQPRQAAGGGVPVSCPTASPGPGGGPVAGEHTGDVPGYHAGEHSLGNFGVHLPSQLKLNDSCLGSVRDLGTFLGRLQLEVLDPEGNNVEDLGQVRYLQLCLRLAMLTL